MEIDVLKAPFRGSQSNFAATYEVDCSLGLCSASSSTNGVPDGVCPIPGSEAVPVNIAEVPKKMAE